MIPSIGAISPTSQPSRESSRKEESLDGFWDTLSLAKRTEIEAIALDMWEPYVQSIHEHVPEAETKIVFDKFHIAKHLHEAVDKVRRRSTGRLRE